MALPKKVLMAASGDLRQSANETCWPAQEAMEKQVAAAVAEFGVKVERAHPYDPALKHGFIDSQKHGMEVFSKIDPATRRSSSPRPLAVQPTTFCRACSPTGPILTVANWSGSGRAWSACSTSTAR